MGETSNVFEGGVKQGRAKLDSESDESDPDFINNAPFTYERKRKVKSNLSKGRKRIRTTKRGKGPKEAEDTQHELSRSILTKIFDAGSSIYRFMMFLKELISEPSFAGPPVLLKRVRTQRRV